MNESTGGTRDFCIDTDAVTMLSNRSSTSLDRIRFRIHIAGSRASDNPPVVQDFGDMNNRAGFFCGT